MAFNGSGTFNLIYNWENDAAAAIDISAPRMDAQEADIAANGLSLCLTRDGQGAASANLPMNGYIHTGVGNALLLNQYTSASQAQTGLLSWAITAGTANAITANYSPAVAALVDGMTLGFRASASNTTSNPTFAPNGFTAHTITKKGGSALSANDIQTNQECIVRYNLANTRWDLLNPGAFDPSGLVVPSAQIIVGNASNVGTAVAMSGDATITNAGVLSVTKSSASVFGIAKVDGTTITASGGVITATAGTGTTGANPTATIGASAVNGVATTFLRSDGAPALPATLPALSGVNLTNLNGSNIASGTVAVARLPADVAYLDIVQTFTKSQRGTPVTLSAASSTITPDFDASQNFTVTLVHANTPFTFANPSTTPVTGQSGVIEVIQSSTGTDLISTWGSNYTAPGGVATLTLSTGVNARDYFSYYVADSTHIVLSFGVANATH